MHMSLDYPFTPYLINNYRLVWGMWSNGTANRLKELNGTKINLLTV